MGKVGISFAIGGSIAAVIMVIGMFTLATDTISPSTTVAMGITGHYTVKVMDSDGNLKAYIQTDNALTHLLRDCLWDNYFGTTFQTGPNCLIGSPTIRVGDGLDTNPTAASDAGLVNEYTNSGTGAALISASTASSGANTPSVTWSNSAAKITISQADLNASTNGGQTNLDGVCTDDDGSADTLLDCELDEVGLFDGTNDMLSHATLAKTLVRNGDQVDVALTISIT